MSTRQPALLCLHGMTGHGALWEKFAADWPGLVLSPDLAGHGGGLRLEHYDYQSSAELAIEDVWEELQGRAFVLVGHSLGSHVALAIAANRTLFDVDVRGVWALGYKASWSERETEQMQAIAARGVRYFCSRTEALRRYVKIAGLDGLIDVDGRLAALGVTGEGDRWALNLDTQTYGTPNPVIDDVLPLVEVPVQFARGENDAVITTDEAIERLGHHVILLDGLGHNAHVQAPAQVYTIFKRFADSLEFDRRNV